MSAGSSTYIQNNLGQVAFYFWVSVISFLKKKKQVKVDLQKCKITVIRDQRPQ